MSEKDILILSVRDFLTPKMLKYSLLPFILTIIVMYILFFVVAGAGVEHLSTMDIQTTQTTLNGGVPHTESFSAHLEGSSIIQFLMKYTLTSWIASFLIYTIGSLFVVYLSIFVAVVIIGFLTPFVMKELQKRHYHDVELIGHSNPLLAFLLVVKWFFVMILLFILLTPLYFIPLINIVAFNLPFYYFFHNMITYDISSNIATDEEDKKIRFFSKNRLRVKTIFLYLISLIPFTIFFAAIFYVIYLGNTYFEEVRKLRA